ncbi:MAG: family 16 glycosylhydrolase [Candidatus Fimenecus sp.]
MVKNIPTCEKLTLSPDEWKLTFEDNFEFFDKTKWKVNTSIDKGNPELNGIRRDCFYAIDDDILFVKDGKLYIRTMWKNGELGEGWYSAMLETSQAVHNEYALSENYKGFSQVRGYFEVRCKVSKAVGIWSAFWLMPDNDIAFSDKDIQFSGEDGVEIDVMESPHAYRWAQRNKNQNIHVIHADGYDDRLKSVSSPSFYVPNMYGDFHTYGVMWDEDKYSFYIDGYKTWETEHIYKGKKMGICKVPEYLLLSTEVAGTFENGVHYPGLVKNGKNGKWEKFWCGNPDKNDKSKAYDFIIDYVKCYSRK